MFTLNVNQSTWLVVSNNDSRKNLVIESDFTNDHNVYCSRDMLVGIVDHVPPKHQQIVRHYLFLKFNINFSDLGMDVTPQTRHFFF